MAAGQDRAEGWDCPSRRRECGSDSAGHPLPPTVPTPPLLLLLPGQALDPAVALPDAAYSTSLS